MSHILKCKAPATKDLSNLWNVIPFANNVLYCPFLPSYFKVIKLFTAQAYSLSHNVFGDKLASEYCDEIVAGINARVIWQTIISKYDKEIDNIIVNSLTYRLEHYTVTIINKQLMTILLRLTKVLRMGNGDLHRE